ncbi:LysR substrate-binding domain-containing protein [Gynuella sp.]|uniref:LysR substrate-binding domain-containing protein n=1 Tax=Gynuella sp. TaxID=2969146 RepID=UPI003D0D52A6
MHYNPIGTTRHALDLKGTKPFVQSSYKFNSGHMAKSAALKGLGFTILPLHVCQADIDSDSFIKIGLNCEPDNLVLYALYPGTKYPLAKVKAFIEHLQISLTDLFSDGS